jgi:hypothetical protein
MSRTSSSAVFVTSGSFPQPPAPPLAPAPPGIDHAAEQPAPGQPPPGGEVYTEYLDDATGRTYFVSDDGVTTLWERPQAAHVVRSESVVEAIAQGRVVVGI